MPFTVHVPAVSPSSFAVTVNVNTVPIGSFPLVGEQVTVVIDGRVPYTAAEAVGDVVYAEFDCPAASVSTRLTGRLFAAWLVSPVATVYFIEY